MSERQGTKVSLLHKGAGGNESILEVVGLRRKTVDRKTHNMRLGGQFFR